MKLDPGLVQWAIFLVLGSISLVLALGMTLTMSMYRAGLSLMGSFLALAGLFFLLGADLLGLIQVMMNVAGMSVMVLFMVMLMMDPGGEMMGDMARRGMRTPGFGAFQMGMPRGGPADRALAEPDYDNLDAAQHHTGGSTMTDTYTCPMHPEVKSKSPGKCPKCGMNLVPKAGSEADEQHQSDQSHSSATAGLELRLDLAAVSYKGRPLTEWLDRLETLLEKTEGGEAKGRSEERSDAADTEQTYACPMHPEVVRAEPGKCPKCGMDLELQAAGSDAKRNQGEKAMDHGQHSSAEGQNQMMVGMAMSTAQTKWALPISLALAVVISAVVARPIWPVAATVPTKDAVLEVGTLLLSRYMIAFEGAAMLILAGIVTAVMMGRRERSDLAHSKPAPAVVLEPALAGREDNS